MISRYSLHRHQWTRVSSIERVLWRLTFYGKLLGITCTFEHENDTTKVHLHL